MSILGINFLTNTKVSTYRFQSSSNDFGFEIIRRPDVRPLPAHYKHHQQRNGYDCVPCTIQNLCSFYQYSIPSIAEIRSECREGETSWIPLSKALGYLRGCEEITHRSFSESLVGSFKSILSVPFSLLGIRNEVEINIERPHGYIHPITDKSIFVGIDNGDINLQTGQVWSDKTWKQYLDEGKSLIYFRNGHCIALIKHQDNYWVLDPFRKPFNIYNLTDLYSSHH
jgi:hypothetical protein